MTPAEICAALRIPDPAALAAELGHPITPAPQPRPELVLDFRGGPESSNRWERFAKPPIPELRKPLAIDGVTGLRTEEAK